MSFDNLINITYLHSLGQYCPRYIIVTALIKLISHLNNRTLIVNRATEYNICDLGALQYYSNSEFLLLREMQQSENDLRCDHAVSDAEKMSSFVQNQFLVLTVSSS